MDKVKVVSDENKNVLFVSENNPDYGWLFVEQVATQIENGWLRNVRRKARIMGKISDLQELGYTADTELPGKIIVKESFTPFNLENPDRDLKIAGTTGVICRLDDQPIYRQTFYTTNENLQDELIHHNNNLEIKEVMNAQKSVNILNIKKVSDKIEL
jgi:hypothetical protein